MSELIFDTCAIVAFSSLTLVAISIGTHLITRYDYSIVPLGLIFFVLAGMMLNTIYEIINKY